VGTNEGQRYRVMTEEKRFRVCKNIGSFTVYELNAIDREFDNGIEVINHLVDALNTSTNNSVCISREDAEGIERELEIHRTSERCDLGLETATMDVLYRIEQALSAHQGAKHE